MAHDHDDPAQPGEHADERLPTQELETLLSRPPSRRKRLAQLGLLLAVGVLLLVLFWGAIVPRSSVAPALTPQPTKTPATLLITSDVNYGTITVNGKKQRKAPPLLVEIHGDTYDIRLDAPSFRPKTCQVRLSSAQPGPGGGTCQVSPTGDQLMTINGSLASPAFQITILLTFADLPADQQSQVNSLLTQSLTTEQNLTVPVGSYFATDLAPNGQTTSQRATTPLRASAIVAPIASSNQDYNPSCAGLICAGHVSLDPVPSGHLWAVVVFVALRWRFSQASGVAVGDVTFSTGDAAHLFVSYDAAIGWSISLEPDLAPSFDGEIHCDTGMGVLYQLINAPGPLVVGTSHDEGAQGCELLLMVNNADQGTYLWRFGVLMAADAKAHAFLPQLPVAPPEELAAIGG